MTRLRVVNASPLICLARSGHLDLLSAGCVDVLIPSPVVVEVLAGPETDAARMALVGGWGRQTGAIEVPPAVMEWGLGAGESSVIATALVHQGSTAVLDDAEARRCARTLGVHVMGSLAVVIDAARHKLIPAAGPVLLDLRRAGIYLSDALVRDALARSLGETWEP